MADHNHVRAPGHSSLRIRVVDALIALAFGTMVGLVAVAWLLFASPQAASHAAPELDCSVATAESEPLVLQPRAVERLAPWCLAVTLTPSPTPAPAPTPTSTATPTTTPSPAPTASSSVVAEEAEPPSDDASSVPADPAQQEQETPSAPPTVDELAAWLITQTGREFTSPSTVDFVRSTGPTQEAIETAISVDTWSLWSTLGLAHRDDSRRVAADAWIEAGQGACCPARVVLSDDTLRTSFITVHELAHALDWERVRPAPSVKAISPLLAIAEGNAQRMARLWAEEIGTAPDDIDAAAALFVDEDDPRLPPAVRRILEYPYVEGLAFAEAIAAERGEDGIVDAFTRPPNGAEVLNPQRWLAGETWPEIAPPVELLDGRPSAGGQLGAFMLALLIEPTVGESVSRALADSWLADSYVISHTVEQSCIGARIVVRDPASAAAISNALRAGSGFAESRETTVNFTRCT